MQKPKQEALSKQIVLLEEKVDKLLQQRKDYRAEIRRLKKRNKDLQESRESWKQKSKARLQDRNALKNKLLRYESAIGFSRYQYPFWMMDLAVQLRIVGKCSYESIVKILQIVCMMFFSVRAKHWQFPCRQTLQNWLEKVGYYQLECTENEYTNQQVCLFIDESIRVGTEKLLLVLVCPFEKVNSHALTTQDVAVLYLAGSTCWTAELIVQKLRKVMEAQSLQVEYMVSDEGNNLKKAAKLLGIPHVPDISHVFSTCLRRVFNKDEDYQSLIKTVGQLQAKLAMGEHAYLRPAKQRAKARFLNQRPLLDWLACVKQHWETLCQKAQHKLAAVLNYQQLTHELNSCVQMAEVISSSLKTKGLNHQTLQEAWQRLAPGQSSERTDKFVAQVQSYLRNYQQLLEKLPQEKTFHSCSDVIESMFGIYKAKVSDNYFVGITGLSLELPLVCLTSNQLAVVTKKALSDIKMEHLKQWKKSDNTQSQAFKRMKFLKT